jgi:hypothetical protein
VLFVILLLSPTAANGQSLELYGSAGPTLTDTGNSFAAGAGFSPTSYLTLVFTFERTHLSTETKRDDDVISSFRGGTLFLGTAEVRYTPFRRNRVGPFALAGLATGVSRPNVNELFRNPATNFVQAMFVGGGVQAPVGERMTVFAEARMLVGAEGREGMVGVAPARVGLAWRF